MLILEQIEYHSVFCEVRLGTSTTSDLNLLSALESVISLQGLSKWMRSNARKSAATSG